MIKLIITDMDGTLLDGSGNLDREFFGVLDKLLQLDIIFAAASGRQYYQLMNNFGNYADHIAYIAENGSLVMVHDKELYLSVLNRENVLEMLKDIEKLLYYVVKKQRILIQMIKIYLRKWESIIIIMKLLMTFLKLRMIYLKSLFMI